MEDLVQFLRARLDEDEQTLREANTSPEMVTGIPNSYAQAPVALHIARFADPARVLREVDAKRQLVYEFEQTGSEPDTPEHRASPHWQGDFGYLQGLARAVHLLALPYVDHPDYREEWRP